MNSQESVSIEKENKVQNELQIQKTLKQARDSFQTQDVTAMDVLKCEYVDKNTVLYDNKEYNISMCEDIHKYVNSGETVYVPIIVLQHESIHRAYTTGWYVDKNRANRKIRELEKYKDSFRYKLDKRELILHKNHNKIFEKIYASNKLKVFSNLDAFLLLTIPYCIYMLIYILLSRNEIIQASSYTSILSIFLLSATPVIIQYIIRYINSNFENIYYPVDIDYDTIDKLDLLTDDNSYSVITVDIDITDESVELYSEELDCTWKYNRDEDYVLPDSIVKLLDSVPTTNGSCVLSVKDNGYNDSSWMSECGKWWIDTDSFINDNDM